jgi:hypothetical protein
MMDAHEQRDARAILEHVLDDALVGRLGVLSERPEAEHVAKALDDRGLPGSAPADEHVQVLVEADGAAIKEAALPGHCDELGVRLRHRVAGEPDARDRVEERLPEPFERGLGHLHPARRRRRIEVLGLGDVARVDDGHCRRRVGARLALVVGVLVLEDGLLVLRRFVDRAGDLHAQKVRVLPRVDARLPVKRVEEPLVLRDVRGDREAALRLHALQKVREGLLAERRRRLGLRDVELAKEALKLGVGGRRRIQAKDVNALARGDLEAGEHRDATRLRLLTEDRDGGGVVVVCDGDDLDLELHAVVEELLDVGALVHAVAVASERLRVVRRVHLERAAVELRPLGKCARGLQWSRVGHCLTPPAT